MSAKQQSARGTPGAQRARAFSRGRSREAPRPAELRLGAAGMATLAAQQKLRAIHLYRCASVGRCRCSLFHCIREETESASSCRHSLKTCLSWAVSRDFWYTEVRPSE